MEDSINKENVPEDEWDILPCGHRICIEPEMAPDKTRGGLFVPISVKERHVNEAQVGTVTAIGPQAWKAFEDGTPWAEVGDRVACIKHAGVVLDIHLNTG